ncbi:MAG: hypothetical protein Kow00109_10450 [Acidobacteriota bacterium]
MLESLKLWTSIDDNELGMATILYLRLTRRPRLSAPLLERVRERFQLVEADRLEGLKRPFDVCLLEADAEPAVVQAIRERRRREAPILLPFLLVGESRGASVKGEQLADLCDESVAPEIPAEDLIARVERFLALRSFSQEWKERIVGGGTPLDRAHLRSIVYGIGDGVIATDREGRVELMNPVAERLTGWREAEAVGKPIEEVFRIVNEETRREVPNPVRRVLEEGVVLGLANHTLLISRSGEEFAIADSGAPVIDDRGEVVGTVLVFRDQTAERRAQREVAAARAFAEVIVETLHEALLVLDADFRVVAANAAFYRLFRTSPSETEGRTLSQLGDGQWDIPELRDLLQRILPEGGSITGYEVVHDFPGLGMRHIMLNARRLPGDENRPQLILLALEDVTERRAAERALAESEERYRHLSQLITDYAYAFRVLPEGRLQGEWVTESFVEAFGLTLEEVGERGGWQSMVYPEDLPVALAHARKVAAGEPDVCEMRFVARDGTVRWIRDHAVPVWDESHERVVRIYGASQDITELKKAELELRKREAFLRSIWESTPEMLLVVGREGGLLDANPAARRLLGRRCGPELGNLFDHLGQEAQAAVRRALEDAWRGRRWVLEVRWKQPSGDDRWIELRVAPLVEAGGEIGGILLLGVDVTERKAAEERISRLNRMLSLLSEVNQTIVRERDVSSLLQRACQIAVEHGRFSLAWIGLLDPVSGYVRVAAAAGGPESYLEKLRINVSDARRGSGPTGLCLRTGKPVVSNDVANDPRMAPWREEALRAGFHSSVALPLQVFGRIRGTLNLYSRETGYFTAEELRLLEELATDVSFALEFAEREQMSRDAEESLRASEERFRILAEQSLVGIYLMREDRFLYVNQAAADLFGYEREEILRGVTPLELTAEADRELVAANIRKRLSGEVAFVRYVFRGRRKDGSTVFLDAHGARIELPDGPAILGALVDVTQRVHAEQELRRSRELLQLILDTVPVRIFWKDRNSVYQGCNRPFALDAGLEDPTEIIGKTDFDLGWAREADLYRADDARVMESGEPLIGYEEPQHTPDGGVRWLRTSKVPLRDDSGEIVGVLGTYEDITERKLALEALAESEERFRMVVENTAAAILLYDETGYVFVNPAAEKLTGYTAEELRGVRPWELAAPEFQEQARAAAERRLAGDRTPQRYEVKILTKQGRERWVDLWTVGVTWKGRPAGLVSGLDVTERRKLETQLAQAQKMEAVGQLAGGVAHDFNNMLSVILGYAELARLRVPETDPLWSDLEEIRLAAQRSADLTRQLLAFARRQIISPRPVDLNRVVEESLRSLRRLIPEEIRIDFVPDVDLWTVNLDPTQIDQILINLATNARDAISGVGSILIETKNVALDEEFVRRHPGSRPGEYVQLVFSDTGCGMDPETLKHIFEPFFTTKETGQGTGLGLATVYGIVKQNDGYISVYSELGGGTVFKLYFPRFQPVAEPVAAPQEVEHVELRGSETILVVEDEAQILSLCEACLRNLGYRVLAAENPRRALELLSQRDEPVDLLITDVVMPEMNGRQLWERVRAHSPGTKVLFMSGYTRDSIAHRGILEPGMNFINKPFSLQAFARKVRETLDS